MTALETRAMRDVFTETVSAELARDPRLVVLLADISADRFSAASARHPGRVVNLGIREQTLIGAAGGLALTGLRPVVHSITPFLVERPFEQLKLDLNHQDVGAVLVSTGASYDYAEAGRTHMAPADIALLDTLPGWTVHVPGHPDELESLLPTALSGQDRVYVRMSEQLNDSPIAHGPGWHLVRSGSAGVVLAVGPMLGPVLEATESSDVTVLYAATIRPFERAGLRAAVARSAPNVLLVEPYLRGTSTYEVNEALRDRPHRVLALGVPRDREQRSYGSAADHEDAYGLSGTGIAAAVDEFFGSAESLAA